MPQPPARARGRLVRLAVLVALASCAAVVAPLAATASPRAAHGRTAYPVGVFDDREPSGLAPPGPSAMPGYSRVYVDDFTSSLDYQLWARFEGVPKGDPAGFFARGHVAVADGLLKIGTWRDPLRGDAWASGGVCLCGLHPTYGAFFVRSRETHVGPDDTQLLWPQDNRWPPELDFDEMGVSAMSSTWTDHFTSATDEVQRSVHLNVTRYHTWGVVWTPTSVTFVVDGRAWGSVTTPSEIPDVPMTLDLQSQTWCGIYPECPHHRSSMLVDWVAVYEPTT